MLSTCEQLASGLGASASKSKTPGGPGGDTVGNAILRHWVGERFLGEKHLISRLRIR